MKVKHDMTTSNENINYDDTYYSRNRVIDLIELIIARVQNDAKYNDASFAHIDARQFAIIHENTCFDAIDCNDAFDDDDIIFSIEQCDEKT